MSLRGRVLAAGASGVVLATAFPEVGLAPVAWVAPAIFLVALDDLTPRRAALIGFAFGVGFFGTLLIWISIVGWAAWAILVALQAAFIAGFGALYRVAVRRAGAWETIAAAITLWVAADFLRGSYPVGGFTWGQLAQSQHDLPWMLRPASLGGAWLVTAVLIGVNAALAEAWRRRDKAVRARAPFAAFAVALLVLPAAVPVGREAGESIRVAVVQGNVPRDHTGSLYEKEIEIIAAHAELTREIEPGSVDLVVWPESSVGIDPRSDRVVMDLIGDAARSVDAPMIVGANLDVDEEHYLVTTLEISPEGEIAGIYQKTHLVPFGEYVPARSVLGWLPILDQVPRDAIAGDEGSLLEVAGGTVAPVISFEGDFGSLVRTRIDAGGRLLVVATNTSTWGRSWASAQHVAFSQLRAAENGVWVLHGAVSGISALIAPDGDVVDRTDLWTAAVLTGEVTFAAGVTVYARVGDWVPALGLLAAAAFAIRSVVRRRKDRFEG